MAYSKVFSRILSLRKDIIGDPEEFFSPTPQLTHPADELYSIDEAVSRIAKACENNEKITIYGDYDADGVTSTGIMFMFLKAAGADVEYYIPSRMDEGYGISIEAINKIKETGTTLIISVDCGSNSYEEAEYAESIGMDVVITDHHTVDKHHYEGINVNPKHPKSSCAFPQIAGVGVAFKVLQQLQIKLNLDKRVLLETLDLVAIGTIADIMPVYDENRTYIKYGLLKMNKNPNLGLRCLLRELGIADREIKSDDVSFRIAPCINAAGRLENASIGVELFITDDEKRAMTLARDLVNLNTKRKELQVAEVKRSKEKMVETGADKNAILLTLDIHSGVAGIVSGKLKEDFGKVAIVMVDTGDGYLKASGRSPDAIDLYQLLLKFQDLYVNFGGHSAACGFTIKKSDENIFRERFYRAVDDMVEADPGILKKNYKYDLKVDVSDMNLELASELKMLEPYGKLNEDIRFLIEDVVPFNMIYLGRDSRHIKFFLKQARNTLECMCFNAAAEVINMIEEQKHISIIGKFGANEYRGKLSPQITVSDII